MTVMVGIRKREGQWMGLGMGNSQELRWARLRWEEVHHHHPPQEAAQAQVEMGRGQRPLQQWRAWDSAELDMALRSALGGDTTRLGDVGATLGLLLEGFRGDEIGSIQEGQEDGQHDWTQEA